jgi:hypothetical protein
VSVPSIDCVTFPWNKMIIYVFVAKKIGNKNNIGLIPFFVLEIRRKKSIQGKEQKEILSEGIAVKKSITLLV